jgi:amino acid permease
MDVENKAASGGEKDSRQSVISIESYLDVRDQDKVQRKLRQRHVQM